MAGLHDDAALEAIAQARNDDVLNEKKSNDVYISEGGHSSTEGPGGDWEVPTEEERATLRRIAGPISYPAFLIGIVEFAERFSFYGASVVFTNFVQQPLPDGSRTGAGGAKGQSGALGLGQNASTGITTLNQFWAYTTPLLGAYIADTYLGRFNTIMVAIVITLIGHVIMIVSALPTVLEHPHGALGALVMSIIVVGIGTGGLKPNISTLIAEQIERKQTGLAIKTLKSGERVIMDPAITTTRVYNIFYALINVGALTGQIGMVYCEKYVGFWLSYLLPTVIFLLCPLVMIFGSKLYVKRPPEGSVLGDSLRLLFFAAKGRWSLNPVRMYKNLRAPDFWDSAKPSRIAPENRPRWMVMDDQWVDEVRRGFKACAVFTFIPLYWVTYNQINNNLVSQAATLNTHGLPNDILNNLDPLALLIFIPIFDLGLYPALRHYKLGWTVTPLKRILYGFITGALAMLCAALVQMAIYHRSSCGYQASTCDPVDLNVWIQTPSYVLIAISEIFASITGLEYAFTLAPKNMRSVVMSAFLFTSAIGSAINEALNPLAADPNLIWNYGVSGVLALLSGIAFWICFWRQDREYVALIDLPEGHKRANAPEVQSSAEKQVFNTA